MNVWQEIIDLKEGFEKTNHELRELQNRTGVLAIEIEELKKWAATLTNVMDASGNIKP